MSNGPEGVRIVIPYWLGWSAFSFLVFWTLGNAYFTRLEWLQAMQGSANTLTWSRIHVGEAFCVVGLVAILWMTCGREVVSVTVDILRIRRQIFGIGWSQDFTSSDVKDLRAGYFLDPKARGKWNPSFVRAALYFEYRGKLRSFGKELTTSDSLRLVAVIRQSFPQIVLKAD